MYDYDSLLTRYLELFREEENSLRSFREFLSLEQDPESLVDRKNYRGHITASCLLVDAMKQRILLFFHPTYHLTLQPGGHFARHEESPVEVATRKLFGETLYSTNEVRYMPYDYESLVPLDIDTHDIRANRVLNEPPHVHHDFRYVFLSTTAGNGLTREVQAQRTSSNARLPDRYYWYDLPELRRWETFKRIYPKLQEFLSKDSARRRFYIRLKSDIPVQKKVNAVVVTHILPDAFDFLDLLNRSCTLIGIIPKPKSVDEKTKKRLIAYGLPILELSREDIAQKLPDLLKNCEDGTVLLDIGGWFVPSLKELPDATVERILGIVEDTKNGQDKYEAYAKKNVLPFPVVSLAKSALKANEDYQVGRSIVFSADACLRECGLVLEYLDCGVIGYGPIGRSIAHHLQQRGVRPFIVEKDPLRRLQSYRNQCRVRHQDWVNRNVDVLFCATGKRATDIIAFRSLRPGAFVFSVTSSDDEFDKALLDGEYSRKETSSPDVSRYDGKVNHFYLVNEGNAVNFLHKAVLWEFIQLVKGGLFLALRNLAEGRSLQRVYPDHPTRGPGFDALYELSKADQSALATLWMETVFLGVTLES